MKRLTSVQTLHMYMDVSVWLSVRSYGVDPKVIVATSINPKIIGGRYTPAV